MRNGYPHVGGCHSCYKFGTCNHCGAKLQRREACTNGRCAKCHGSVCTPGGDTSPGHGYGSVGKFGPVHGPMSAAEVTRGL